MSNAIRFIDLGSIAEFRNGLNFGKENKGKGCALIGVKDFQKNFTPQYKNLEEINPEGIAKDDDYLRKGDLVFVRSNGNRDLVGRSLYINKDVDALYSGFCIRARLKTDDIDPLFLAYYTKTKHFRSSISSASGTNINNLNQGILSNAKIPSYAKSVQLAIARVLSFIDKKIELNNQINAELEAMAKTIYDYWFVQFDFPDEQGQPYKSAGGKMVYNEVLKREIPVGWRSGSLWDIAKYYNGLALQKHRPVGDDYLPVIKIREMKAGIGKNTEKASPNIPSKAIVHNGDVLFSWSASLEISIWSHGIGALNQHIFKVTSDDYPKSFYYFELLNYLSHFKMMAEKRKTTMGHITLDHLKQSMICIPPNEPIENLDNILMPILNQHLANEVANIKLAELRDWLLPMLMNGQVTVR